MLVFLLVLVGALVPVPYVALSPGPTSNTLGSQDGKQLIRIEGHRTYPTAGHLQLLTVYVSGGPQSGLNLLQVVRDWFDSSVAVVPRASVYPPNTTDAQVQQENAEEMTTSQQSATVAALHEANIAVTTSTAVGSIVKGAPALGHLKAGDVILSVDGTTITDPEQVATAVRAEPAGSTLTFVVRRGGQQQTVQVVSKASPQDASVPYVGITATPEVKLPFTVDIQLDDVGGPSAGMMFALGIYDKLTPGELNGGEFVAGTGTIDDSGTVGPIGGIKQKLVGARRAGATWFLAPAGNCDEVTGSVPDGLQVVKVSTLDGAVTALHDITAGRTSALPHC